MMGMTYGHERGAPRFLISLLEPPGVINEELWLASPRARLQIFQTSSWAKTAIASV